MDFLPNRFGKLFRAGLGGGAFLLALSLTPARANLPGGGTGTGANVTLTTNSTTATLSNGLITVAINKATAQILTMTYNGVQATDGGTSSISAFYWQGSDQNGNEETPTNCTYTLVTDPASNGGNSCEISLKQTYPNSGATTNDPVDSDFHFSLFRGSTGIYATQIITRLGTYPAGVANPYSQTLKLNSAWNWLAEDPGPNRAMYTTTDVADALSGVNFAPKEVTLLTTGTYAGTFDCKYDYSCDLGTTNCTGWLSTSSDTGIWIMYPSREYYTCGPLHHEILSQIQLINQPFNGGHFGFTPDLTFAAGETWTRVYGPYLIYMNSVPSGTSNPQVALFDDAHDQALAEQAAWPYSWFTNSAYVQSSGRGTVTGRMVINDNGNPNASGADLWVGVVQQPSSTTAITDFQLWGKPYQFWAKADANGNFTIPNVIAGANYTLFAFGPGAIGQFQSQALSGNTPPISINTPASTFSVTVTGGNTTSLGNVTWTPTRVGSTVWEIGVPDRDTQEFFHGADAWHGDEGNATAPAENWAPFQDFDTDFPNGLTYTVGQSHWATGWDYAQPALPNLTGNFNGNLWKIIFTLPQAPMSGAGASIYLAIAGDYAGPIIVTVNGVDVSSPSTGEFAGYSSDPMIRMSSHGIFCDLRVNFSGSDLKAGQNEIDLNMRKGGYFENDAMYDYVRLELGNYVPPAPASLTALGGNGLVALDWSAAPGATSYRVLRSTTSGSGYTTLAGNVTGPVAGSTGDTATYSDTSVVNGDTYYYVVQSVNPTGTSANSTQATATPSASSAAAPSAPTGLTASAGNTQIVLSWTASTGAADYDVERGNVSGGPYTAVTGPVTGTTYTDIGLDNAVTYYYVVTAANANGVSPASAEASAQPMPPAPGTPTGLTANASGGNITLSWSAVTGATSYVVLRATSPSGTYTALTKTQPYTNFTDTTAAKNTTYYYIVAAENLDGSGGNSTTLSLTSPPAAPTLAAVGGTGNVALSWNAPTGATSYIVRRATTSGGSYSTLNSTLAATNYTDTGLTNNTTYFYVVQASSANGTSANSTEAGVTPLAAPTALAALAGTGSVTLTWSAVSGAANYTVRRAIASGGPYSALNSTVATTSYSDTSPVNGTPYYYVVSAANSTVDGAITSPTTSANSTQVSATPLAVPAATASAGTGAVMLSWGNITGATNYAVRRATVSGGPYATLSSSIASAAYSDSGLANGTTYFYVVAALNTNGLSGNSAEVSATPLAPPANVTATAGDGNVSLSWSASTGATTYTVLRSTTSGGNFTTLASNVTGTTDTDHTALNGTTYYYLVEAANANGLSGNSAQVGVVPAQTFAQWIAAYFPNQTSSQIIGSSATPSSDGLPNLLKYFLGLDPTVVQPPDAVTTTYDGNGDAVLTFRVSKNLTGVSYTIEQSTDLVNWTDTGLQGAATTDEGSYTLMQASVPLGANPLLFLRLQVSLSGN